jgi:hypothetical protein
MMRDESTGDASAGASGFVAASGLCPVLSPPPGAVGTDSPTSSSLIPSSEVSNGGKGIGLSMTAMHLATGNI